jgi:hypothetical protein
MAPPSGFLKMMIETDANRLFEDNKGMVCPFAPPTSLGESEASCKTGSRPSPSQGSLCLTCREMTDSSPALDPVVIYLRVAEGM